MNRSYLYLIISIFFFLTSCDDDQNVEALDVNCGVIDVNIPGLVVGNFELGIDPFFCGLSGLTYQDNNPITLGLVFQFFDGQDIHSITIFTTNLNSPITNVSYPTQDIDLNLFNPSTSNQQHLSMRYYVNEDALNSYNNFSSTPSPSNNQVYENFNGQLDFTINNDFTSGQFQFDGYLNESNNPIFISGTFNNVPLIISQL